MDENSNIRSENMKDFANIEEHLIDVDQDFHWFKPKNKKTHAFAVKGLGNIPTLEEIIDELKENEVSVNNEYLMKGTRSPLYLVVAVWDIALKSLQISSVFNLHQNRMK